MKTVSAPSRNYATGTRNFDVPQAVSRKFTGFSASLTRESWPAGAEVKVEFRRLSDNAYLGGATFPGGTIPGEATSSVSFKYRTGSATGPLEAQDGDVRVVVTNSAPVRTAINITMDEPA